jgi:Uma2 family endonuclease
MIETPTRWLSAEEYLVREAQADYKSEYFDGEVFAMAGGTPEHNLITANVISELVVQLSQSPCRVYTSDQRVNIPDTGLYTYPDVTVVCAEPQYEEPERRALLNPILIIEVLSESTEAYDRGDKFAHYRRLASLRDYVLVASDRRSIERFSRVEGGAEWLLTECTVTAGAIELPSVGGSLSLDRVYSKVEFPNRRVGKRRGPGEEPAADRPDQ